MIGMRTLMNDLHMNVSTLWLPGVVTTPSAQTAQQTSRSQCKIPLKQRAPAARDNEMRPINLNVVSGTVILTICRSFSLITQKIKEARTRGKQTAKIV